MNTTPLELHGRPAAKGLARTLPGLLDAVGVNAMS